MAPRFNEETLKRNDGQPGFYGGKRSQLRLKLRCMGESGMLLAMGTVAVSNPARNTEQ